MDNVELIQQARELCEKASTEKANGNAVDSAALSWAIAQNIVPRLCDALEAAQKELIDYHHTQKVADGKTAENARLRKINEQLTARAEKAEAERDKAAEFIRWVDDNFSHYMPQEYTDRLMTLERNHFKSPQEGE